MLTESKFPDTMGNVMDPDEQEFHRQQIVTERQRLAQIEQVKQSVQPFVQAAQSGGFGISDSAGQAMLKAIHHCQDGLETAQYEIRMIQQNTKLGISPDALVMTKFNKEVAAGGSNSAVTALESLREILTQMEAGVIEAMKHYHRTDEDGARGLSQAGS